MIVQLLERAELKQRQRRGCRGAEVAWLRGGAEMRDAGAEQVQSRCRAGAERRADVLSRCCGSAEVIEQVQRWCRAAEQVL